MRSLDVRHGVFQITYICLSVSKQSKYCGHPKKHHCIGADNVTDVSTFKSKQNRCSNASGLANISLYSGTF